ncbi:MAG: T9SS type A sorting domain-containing protein, partial [Nitrosopumilus sp.]
TEYSYIDNTVEIGKTYDYRLADVSYAGVKEYHSMTVLGVTVTEDIPDKFVLYPAYPNPFNPSTTIEFQIPEAVQVKLTVYDLQGREVKALINGLQEAGSYSVKFNGKNDNGVKLSSGIYFVLMRAKETTTSKKIVLLR